MGRRNRRGRPIDGILVLDKPAGISSNAALQTAKRLYYAAKAGHTGSLDPLATGVLPICFGEATKFSRFLLDADKAYQATVVLGARSSTGDAEGEITAAGSIAGLSAERVQQVAETMLGEQMQLPPMVSALKHQGRRLYELAREGVEVEREPRKITVKRFEVANLRPYTTELLAGCELLAVDIEVDVSKGTYVRTLAEDLGVALGSCGYIAALRRTTAGCFNLGQAVTLDELESLKATEQFEPMDARLLPVTAALEHLPKVVLDENSSFYLRRGNPVQVPKAPTQGVVSLLEDSGEFIGVGEIDEQGLVAPRRLVVSEAASA